MAEVYPSDATLNAITTDSETGAEFISTGTAPCYLNFRKLWYRLILALKRANDLRVYDEGTLDIGVKAGKFWDGTTLRTYAGSTGNTLADDKAAIYVYINSAGTLVITEYTAFPATTVNHVRLATVTTASSDITAIVDARDHHSINTPAGIVGGNFANVGSDGTGLIIFTATLTAGSTVQIHNADAPYKYRVLDAWSIAKSADGGTWKLTDGTDDITNAVTVTGTDKTINRAGTIDDAKYEIAADGSLSVVGDGANADCEVYIQAIRVA